jgi:hypothetical protein
VSVAGRGRVAAKGEGEARMKRRPKDTKSGVAVVSGAQIRAARGFLCWDQRDLAMMAVVPLFAVERIETMEKVADPLALAMAAMQRALEAAGIEFTDGDEPGVKLKSAGKAAKAKSKRT